MAFRRGSSGPTRSEPSRPVSDISGSSGACAATASARSFAGSLMGAVFAHTALTDMSVDKRCRSDRRPTEPDDGVSPGIREWDLPADQDPTPLRAGLGRWGKRAALPFGSSAPGDTASSLRAPDPSRMHCAVGLIRCAGRYRRCQVAWIPAARPPVSRRSSGPVKHPVTRAS